MKFTLKKLLCFGFIIFLILIVYKMFLKKYVEGMTTEEQYKKCRDIKKKSSCNSSYNSNGGGGGICDWVHKRGCFHVNDPASLG
jgi:hypothetical protein